MDNTPESTAKSDKKGRLEKRADALRQNLKRRKQQKQEQSSDAERNKDKRDD